LGAELVAGEAEDLEVGVGGLEFCGCGTSEIVLVRRGLMGRQEAYLCRASRDLQTEE